VSATEFPSQSVNFGDSSLRERVWLVNSDGTLSPSLLFFHRWSTAHQVKSMEPIFCGEEEREEERCIWRSREVLRLRDHPHSHTSRMKLPINMEAKSAPHAGCAPCHVLHALQHCVCGNPAPQRVQDTVDVSAVGPYCTVLRK